MKPIEFRALAVSDLDGISDFYSLVGTGVAERWVGVVERLLGEIARRPSFGSTAYGERLAIYGLRYRQVPRFPYVVFYLELENSLSIVRILHERRDIAAELDE